MTFTYRSRREEAETLERELSARCRTAAIHADLRDDESVGSALRTAQERFGGVDSVIFATGANILQPYVSEIAAQQWDEVVQVELIGFTRVIRAALPLMRAQGGGTIVAIGSFATYSFPPGDALSAVPKAAIEMLCRAVAREEGRYGIRANVVAPGMIETAMTAVLDEKQKAAMMQFIPLGRAGTDQEIANAVAFLASEKASYITGHTLDVNGGMYMA